MVNLQVVYSAIVALMVCFSKLALKRLARYLKRTQDRRLVLDTNYDIFKVDEYPEAELAGIYRHKNTDDLACAKSRTSFVITFADCPVLWISKFQTETAFSTM